MKKLLQSIVFLLISTLIILSCQKQKTEESAKQTEDLDLTKEWLSTNGGIFSKQTLTVEMTNGTMQMGVIKWDRVRKLRKGQFEFLELPFYFTLPNQQPTAILNDNGKDMHPTAYSLMVKMVNGKPVIAKLKAKIYDYQSNSADPSKLGLKEYRILFDSSGNFETGLYYEGFNIKSTIGINVNNTAGRGNSCTIATIRTNTIQCTVDANYNSSCYFHPTYSLSIFCEGGTTPEEVQNFLDDGGGGGGGGGNWNGTNQDTAREIIPDTSITNNPIIK